VSDCFSLDKVPEVIYERHPEFIEIYNKAWALAAEHILVNPDLPVKRHMDEGFANDRIWIWDTCFMVHYCKYAPDFFPGIESLDNFYLLLYDNVKSKCKIQHADNPPLFAWVEYEYYRMTGDTSRIHRNLIENKYLHKHYEFFENSKYGDKVPSCFLLNSLQKDKLGYFWSGISSGMDNTPRGHDTYCNIYWLDALAQQALAALCISKLAKVIGEEGIFKDYQAKYEEKKKLLNQYYFDDEDGSYYDIHAATHDVCRVLTPASFWPLLAEVADEAQAEKQMQKLLEPGLLGGEMPAPSVSRNSPYFADDGRYWRGGVWLPTSYMVAKSIEKYGYLEVAAEFAETTVKRMCEVYNKYSPASIWEAYSPTEILPAAKKTLGSICRKDFCGWSALGPISMVIENIIGFYSIDASEKVIKYHYRDIGRHGIKNLKFGDICCDIVIDNAEITVKTNSEISIDVNGMLFECSTGQNVIKINA